MNIVENIEKYSIIKVVNIDKNIEYTLGDGKIKIGDIGTVVDIYQSDISIGYEVECVDTNGRTVWLATLRKDAIEPV